jgi:hypothetical protein
MNKILNLFDENYVIDLFNQKVLPLYPGFKKIEKVNITAVKKSVWQTTYHVVIKFTAIFLTKNNGLAKLPIYCTAHSSEPRKNSFEALSFLWQAGFDHGRLVIPHPLFFSAYFNGFFYRGVPGQTLYHYLYHKDYQTIEDIIPKIAAWFAKLHNTPTAGAKNFNSENSRIKTVIPGLTAVLKKIGQAYPQYLPLYKKIYELTIKKEEQYFANNGQLYLIHGDAHPKNVVRMGKNKIAVIDFTDMCLADFTRDLGAFLQQLDFMGWGKKNDQPFIEKIKNLFLQNYWAHSKIQSTNYIKERVKNYYNWAALRSASFFLTKENPEPANSHELILKICQDFQIKAEL